LLTPLVNFRVHPLDSSSDPAINALKALASASAFRRIGTAAGSEPPSVGRAGLPAADSKV
jgi:hypothetical protein